MEFFDKKIKKMKNDISLLGKELKELQNVNKIYNIIIIYRKIK